MKNATGFHYKARMILFLIKKEIFGLQIWGNKEKETWIGAQFIGQNLMDHLSKK